MEPFIIQNKTVYQKVEDTSVLKISLENQISSLGDTIIALSAEIESNNQSLAQAQANLKDAQAQLESLNSFVNNN